MITGVVFITLALIFYTIAIWWEKFVGHIKVSMVVLFALGFLSDLIGTSSMFIISTNKFSLNLHTISGYVALIIMLLHLIWAALAITKSGNYEKYFTRFSVFAWIVWLLAFGTGAYLNMI